jgi:hypothetical protein
MRIALAIVLCLLPSLAQAQSPRSFVKRLANAGSLFHDSGFHGRENVFHSSKSAFPRIQARVAWAASPGHRANLPMLGLKVSRGPSGVYVVGRR